MDLKSIQGTNLGVGSNPMVGIIKFSSYDTVVAQKVLTRGIQHNNKVFIFF